MSHMPSRVGYESGGRMRLEHRQAAFWGMLSPFAVALLGGVLVAGCTGGSGGNGPGSNPSNQGGSAGTAGMGAGGGPTNPPAGGGDVGTKAIHRLSNVEYDRTVGDLLGTKLTPGTGFTLEEVAL